MDHIVAVEVTLDSGVHRYFLTWGRIQDSIDSAPVEAIILDRSSDFDLGGKALVAKLCATLQVASQEPYFFESFFSMCQKTIPFGPDYQSWREGINQDMRSGREIYYLGKEG
jgi:hypothetical protein